MQLCAGECICCLLITSTEGYLIQEEGDGFLLACVFDNEFGEEGRGYFHAISQFYPGYDRQEAERKFDHALKGKYRRIEIGTFLGMAKAVEKEF
ncbi:MAG: PriCT-2 domain-containing protein [Haliscomenobacter sp.]|nr:PriCT-2 domain-containing protein [Haliscomenobacter sp.]